MQVWTNAKEVTVWPSHGHSHHQVYFCQIIIWMSWPPPGPSWLEFYPCSTISMQKIPWPGWQCKTLHHFQLDSQWNRYNHIIIWSARFPAYFPASICRKKIPPPFSVVRSSMKFIGSYLMSVWSSQQMSHIVTYFHIFPQRSANSIPVLWAYVFYGEHKISI